MARITVEDCLEHVDNRFELVMLATRRARMMRSFGGEPMLPEENDKPTVIALREIAAGLVSEERLDELEFTTDDEELEVSFGVADDEIGGVSQDAIEDAETAGGFSVSSFGEDTEGAAQPSEDE